MKKERLVAKTEVNAAFRVRLLMVCVIFAVGGLLGLLAQSAVAVQDHQRLQSYLLQYARLSSVGEESMVSIFSVAVVYFRYPLLAFVCGFVTAGLLLAPLVCLLQGFFLTFSIGCFASALGRAGVVLALAAFGVRCLFTLPCTLYLAAQAMMHAYHRMRAGKQAERLQVTDKWSVLICFMYLLFGVAAELSVVPKLLQLALAGIS